MSYFESATPICSSSSSALELIVQPQRKDLGDFSVARALPASERQMVGPFIFFDHMGPAELPPGKGIQVRPHPHIGIAAITYLFEGLVVHRDSLGYRQEIEAGAVNLMVAGRGIVHSERAGEDLDRHSRLHGIQSWMALPDSDVECQPEFSHFPSTAIPQIDVDGATVRLIIGSAFGRESPVRSFVPTLYLEALVPAGRPLFIPASVPELAFYVVSGKVESGRHVIAEGTMAIAGNGMSLELIAREDSRVMVIGGAPVGHRELWWNFVARDSERIEQAKKDWRDGRFAGIDGDDEFIPLPED